MADEPAATDDRQALVKIAIAVVWIPLQITLSLIFATGGLMVLALLAIALSPFVGIFFLVRWTGRLLAERAGRTRAPRAMSRHGPGRHLAADDGPTREGS